MRNLIADIAGHSAYFGLAISLIAYIIGIAVKKRLPYALFNPLLTAIVFVIAFLLYFQIDFASYNQGAQFLSWLLTPATVCLAIPLYQQLELLKRNLRAVLAGILTGAVTSLVSILALSMLFRLNHQQYVTLLPKSITNAIGIGVSQELGGVVTITVAAIIVTGIFGNIAAESICRIFRIKEPVAVGLAIGTSAHVMGTTKALEMGEIQGAMSSLAIVVAGLVTVVLAPLFAGII